MAESLNGIKKVAENTYSIVCPVCQKEFNHYGDLHSYRYQIRSYKKNHSYRKMCCSWTCYVKALKETALNKEKLDADDVLLLLRYGIKVPWERVSNIALQQLPSKTTLEGYYVTEH